MKTYENIEVGSGFDASEFEGQKAKLAGYEEVDMPSQFDISGKDLGTDRSKWVTVRKLKVFTEPIATIDGKNGPVQVRASELFNLKKNADGSYGVSTSEKASIRIFMNKIKVKNWNEKEVVGKVVTLKQRGNFLGFVY